MNIKNDITFILTLKDRSEHTENWIKENIYSNFNYLIADGSISDENRNYFLKIQQPNINYKYFGKDETITHYLNKIYNAIRIVETKYVMLCDNDDYINPVGINKCISVLENNIDYNCSGGTIFSIFENHDKNNYFNFPIPFLNNTKLHNIDQKFNAFIETRSEYKYLYYSVFRREILEKIWKTIVSIEITDLFLVEMLYNDLALYYGKYYNIGWNHYIRLMNTNKSGVNSYGTFYHKKIFFDNSYRTQLKKLNKFYSELYIKDEKVIEEYQTTFYLWYFNNPPRIKKSIYRKFHGLIILFPLFKIKTCINALNIFLFLKNKISV